MRAQPLAPAGFSFGTFVTSHALAALWPQHIDRAIAGGHRRQPLLPWRRCRPGPICRRWWCMAKQRRHHGQSAVMDWARPQTLLMKSCPGRAFLSRTIAAAPKILVVGRPQSAL